MPTGLKEIFFLLSLRLLPLVASAVMNYASIIYELIIDHEVIKSELFFFGRYDVDETTI